MAICERRNDWPAALARSEAEDGGLSDLVAARGMPPLWRQGKKIANKPLRVKVGERSERIVARDPPAKGRYGRGYKQPDRRALLKSVLPRPRQRHYSSSAIEPQRFASPIPIQWRRARLLVRGDAVMPRRHSASKVFRRNDRLPDVSHPEDRGAFSNSEAISASGALNRPRRSAGGMTASTASSFSEGSMRR
jgi:hypothetical protein